ncbi:hypothetical protein ACFOGI_02280 [Virgibacillus xinjiangensis]|uniref:LysM domain-containing protein n=1 Tax=Virgibacillus xinjiangensis TaxID=393090 RepID=A0ABV7CRP5_9BACI
MSFLKKSFLYIIAMLLCLSIYQDLFSGKSYRPLVEKAPYTDEWKEYEAIQIKAQPGDTVLSVVEKLNSSQADSLDIDQIIKDWRTINPTSNPHELVPSNYYYFPRYK